MYAQATVIDTMLITDILTTPPDAWTLDNVTSPASATTQLNATQLPDGELAYDYYYDYDDSVDSLPLAEVVPVSLVYGVTLLLGLSGNSLVILVVLRHERLRSITNIFLTSLATADLVLVSFCVPVKVGLCLSVRRLCRLSFLSQSLSLCP